MIKDILYKSKGLNGFFTEDDFSFLNEADNEFSELSKKLEKQKIIREKIVNFVNNFDNSTKSKFNVSLKESKKIFELVNSNINNIYNLQEQFQQLEKAIVEFIVDLENGSQLTNENSSEIKSKINSYSSLYNDLKNNILQNNSEINDFLDKVDLKKEISVAKEDPIDDAKNYFFDVNLADDIKDNFNLIISEKQQKVFLPYTRDEILALMKKYPADYLNGRDVIEQEFIVPISTYSKHSSLARFREGYALIRDKEMKSIIDAFKYAIDLMFKYELNPAIIAACKSEKQLNDYLECLNSNTLNDFKHFNILFEIAPLATKK